MRDEARKFFLADDAVPGPCRCEILNPWSLRGVGENVLKIGCIFTNRPPQI